MKYMFILILTMFTALISYTIVRGYQSLHNFPVGKNIFLITGIVLFICLIIGTGFNSFVAIPFPRFFALVGNTAFLIFFYLIIAFVLIDIVRICNYFFHFAPQGMLAFRQWAFISSLAVIAVMMIVGSYKFNHPKIVQLEINLAENKTPTKEIRIVTASDVHLGVSINKKMLNKYVNLINAQNPDMVIFAGDVCDNRLEPIINQQMNEELRMIKAPMGVYGALGNHEYIGRDVTTAVDYLKSGNITILRDSVALVNDEFYIVGRDDRTNPNRKSIQNLVQGIDKSKPIILIDHQPYHLEEAEENGIDLQLSGHTHDGQFFPINLIVRGMYENAHGYSTRGKTHYYVSSGLGLWGPQYRIGTQSEIVIIDLKY